MGFVGYQPTILGNTPISLKPTRIQLVPPETLLMQFLQFLRHPGRHRGESAKTRDT